MSVLDPVGHFLPSGVLWKILKTVTCPTFQNVKTLSHLSAHMVNRLLRENRKSIPNLFNAKKLVKNVTRQILNFILISNKKFPHMVQC